jgi:hypothetical protein
MKRNITLTVTSVLSALLFISHWVDEISRGFEPGTRQGIGGIGILVVWLCGPLLLGTRRAGHILMLVAGLFGFAILFLHMGGRGMVGGRIANTSGQFFWVWTLIMLGTTSAISAILAAYELWSQRRIDRG